MSDTIRDFAESLCLTEIVSQTDIDAVLDESAGGVQDPQELSEKLAERGLISAFQAERLNHGEPLVIDEYVLLGELGAGGMGRVFKARHPTMARTVVVKIIKEQHATAPDAVNRFNREIKSIAKLDHPNIVRAYHAGLYRGLQYLVMEYVEGEDLARHARKHRPLSIATVVDYLIQAATGLAYAHRQGIVHRDVKPGNLMVDADGRIRVLDLGLAKPIGILAADPNDITDAVTGDGDIVGTSAYMAPEQSQNTQDVDHRSDIYSLGCTLHFLLTCAPVYSGMTAIEKIIAHRTAKPPNLSESRDDVAPELEAVFHKMIAKRPDDRFQSMDEVIVALQRAIGIEGGKSQRAIPEEATGDNHLPTRRNRPLLVAIPVAVFLMGLLLAIVFWPDGDHVTATPDSLRDQSDDVPVAPILPGTESESGRVDRIAAEAVIEAGGHVRLVDTSVSTYEIDDLPSDEFRIQEINLSGKEVASVPLETFWRLPRLTYIDLANTDASSADIQALARSESIETLYLAGTAVQDDAMPAIGEMSNLKNLDLQDTRVTDSGLSHLVQHVELESLFVGQGQIVTNIGLGYISRIPNLKTLTLRQTAITDTGVAQLIALKNLETLDLSQTEMTDASIAHISQLPALRILSLDYTQVTMSRIEQLSRIRPDLQITP